MKLLNQRMGCIPLHIKDAELIENLVVELDITNDSENIMYVTTEDLKLKSLVQQLFEKIVK